MDRSTMTIRTSLTDPDAGAIAQVAEVLLDGEPAIFPTDTVYGIGMAAGPGRSDDAIFHMKRRSALQTLPWLVASPDDLARYGRDIPEGCVELARDLWPGALTIVVRASDEVPENYRASDGTIALRMPNSPVALALIEALGMPLSTTSANIHGRPAVASAAELDPELVSQVPVVLDGGTIPSGVPSTIVSYVDGHPLVIREGSIPASTVLSYV